MSRSGHGSAVQPGTLSLYDQYLKDFSPLLSLDLFSDWSLDFVTNFQRIQRSGNVQNLGLLSHFLKSCGSFGASFERTLSDQKVTHFGFNKIPKNASLFGQIFCEIFVSRKSEIFGNVISKNSQYSTILKYDGQINPN